eukprot:10835441-Alexandrium_andersonii.AAC.1
MLVTPGALVVHVAPVLPVVLVNLFPRRFGAAGATGLCSPGGWTCGDGAVGGGGAGCGDAVCGGR